MKLFETFNASELPKNENNFEAIPAGEYLCNVYSCTLKDTKAPGGKYLSIRYDVTNGQYSKRVIFQNLNIKNSSSEAEKIGRGQLGELLDACCIKSFSDTDQLVGHAVKVKVKVSQYQGEDKTEVKSVCSASAKIPSVIPKPKKEKSAEVEKDFSADAGVAEEKSPVPFWNRGK